LAIALEKSACDQLSQAPDFIEKRSASGEEGVAIDNFRLGEAYAFKSPMPGNIRARRNGERRRARKLNDRLCKS